MTNTPTVSPPYTRASLRALLYQVARADSDLRMLCIDHLPEVMTQLGTGMSYGAMVNAVVEHVAPDRLFAAMNHCDPFAERMSSHRHLLVAEPAPILLERESREQPAALQTSDSAAPPASGPGSRLRAGPPPPKSAYDAGWYLDRADEESRAHAAWEAPGSPVVLQAPELFGKTWLLMRLLAELKPRGHAVYINLKTLGEESLATFATFLRELTRLTLEGCALPAALLEQAFSRSSNPEANLNWLMSNQILPSAGPGRWLVLALDGADALAEKPYFDRFLTLLRGMSETASIPPWGALRLILTLSSTMALRGQDIHRSPLENVAQIIPMADLSPGQVAQMAAWYAQDGSAVLPLSEYVGGHPYLVHLTLNEAQHRRQSVAEVLHPKSRIFDNYLQMCRKRLQQQPELHQVLRAVIADQRATVDEGHATRLIDAGFLIDEYDEQDNRVLRLRYRLYRRLVS